MTMTTQVLLGSAFLTVCALVHIGIVALCVPGMTRLARRVHTRGPILHSAVLLSAALGAILLAHTLQIWIWAASFHQVGAFPDLETSFYFALVTYTTLGYGDLVLGEALRIFATFGAITGLLTFGISTAFLIAVLGRVLPNGNGGRPGF